MKTLLLLITVLFVFTSCKKCDPTNSVGGEIIENAVVKVVANIPGPLLVTNAGQVNFPIEVSFDNQITYEPVDFTKYSVMALPTSASCSSGYDRVVTKDDANQTVTYTITITQCETCEGTTNIQNWVLIPVVFGTYTPIFKVN
jgi:hypothetical protein